MAVSCEQPAQTRFAQEAIGKDLFDSLNQGQAETLCRVVFLSQQGRCESTDTDSCRTAVEFREAWKNLIRLAPQAGRSLLYTMMKQEGASSGDPVVVEIFENHEIPQVESGNLPDINLDATLRGFLFYRQQHPETDLLPALQPIRSAWEVRGPCFSVRDYPVTTTHQEAAEAQRYLFDEFTLAGLTSGQCRQDDLSRIARSLSFGGRVTKEVIEAVVDNKKSWPDDAGFREDFLTAVRAAGHRSPRIEEGVLAIFLALQDDNLPPDTKPPVDFGNSAGALIWLLEGVPVNERSAKLEKLTRSLPTFAVALRYVAEPAVQGKNLGRAQVITDQMERVRQDLSDSTKAFQARLALNYLWVLEMKAQARESVRH